MGTEKYRAEISKAELAKSVIEHFWVAKSVTVAGDRDNPQIFINPPTPEEIASPVVEWEFVGPDDLEVGQLFPVGKIYFRIVEIRSDQPMRTIVLKLPEEMLHASNSD